MPGMVSLVYGDTQTQEVVMDIYILDCLGILVHSSLVILGMPWMSSLCSGHSTLGLSSLVHACGGSWVCNLDIRT